MTESERAIEETPPAEAPRPSPLKDAVREARIELAEHTGVVVDLRNAEFARLQILNDALDPVFADIPANVELFDHGLVPGDPPRLWIDMIAHVVMAHDRRVYRFLQDTRFGRRVLAESADVGEVAAAITTYVARRLVERERALAAEPIRAAREDALRKRRASGAGRGRTLIAFILGVLVGAAGLFAIAWFVARP